MISARRMGGLCGFLLLAGAAAPASAQRASDARLAMAPLSGPQTHASDTVAVGRRPINVGRGIAGGVLGGAVGMVAGAYAGAVIAGVNTCSGEDCGLLQFLVGGLAGEAVGLAVGTHLGARGHGNLLLTTLVSSGIATLGAAAAIATENPIPLVLTVPAQLWAVLALER